MKNPKELLLQFNHDYKVKAMKTGDLALCQTAYRMDILTGLLTQDKELLDRMNEFSHETFMEEMHNVTDLLCNWAFEPVEEAAKKVGDK